ncbi:MAG: response regulator [Deltaproteobacteria bacterium]|nr:response regulator [Deltaproteobacteria bacterium]
MEKTILIVEDDTQNRKLVKELLATRGYRIIEAENGKQGVVLAAEKKPDLILMDVQMPVMNGLDAMKIIKADDDTKSIPVILLTAFAMKEDKERFCKSGCDGYITKPMDTRKFIKIIGEYLAGAG